MATAAGNFPKIVGDIVYKDDYNAIQSVIAGVVNTYYGNAVSSSQITTNTVIGSTEMDNLRSDLNKAYKHITNTDSTAVDLGLGGLIYKDDWNAYKVVADYCETNKATVHASQLTSTVDNQTITVAWNGLHTWTRTFTWASADAANYWFNAGGYFLIDVSGSNSTGSSKDNDWQTNILNAIPSQTYAKTQWDAGSTYTTTEYGNITQYTENYCQIILSKPSSTQFRVSVILNDADTGDQTGVGAAVDENVNTDAAASISIYYSFDAITVTNPAASTDSSW